MDDCARLALAQDAAPTSRAAADVPSRAFWDTYDRKAAACHSDPEARARLRANLSETVLRLCAGEETEAEEGGGDEAPRARTTSWSDDGATLVFVPSRIDVARMREEQRACLDVMHLRHPTASRIDVVVDLRGVTLGFVWALATRAPRDRVVDGVRLWATLPHKIGSVRVVTRDRAMAAACAGVARACLSAKLRARVVVDRGG